MGKHAYLIMAHSQPKLFRILLSLLDDERNDIYVHIDKNSKMSPEDFSDAVKKSKLYFIERKEIKWAGFSMIDCELRLLKEALKGRYDYYHLLSGSDLPIKSQDEIHKFFEDNFDCEFIGYDEEKPSFEALSGFRYFYPFIDVYGRDRKNPFKLALYAFEKVLVGIQKLVKVDRGSKLNLVIQKGPNWFSITNECAYYILMQEGFIRRTFKNTRSGDEVFVQTVVYNSPFREKLYRGGFTGKADDCLRLIDWERGLPYTFTDADYEEIHNSTALFARKFDYDRYPEVVSKIAESVRL